jgi:hypothetical protein
MHLPPPPPSELVHYRGEPDPFKGDVPNARVREFAKEVLEVLFNASAVAPSAAAANSLAAQGRIQGFGSGGEGPSRAGGYSGGGGGGGGGFSGSYSGGGGGGGMGALSSAASALGEGPLAAGVASVTGAINDFLGNPGARAGLSGSRYGNSSPPRNGGYGGFEPMDGYGSSSAATPAARVTAAQVLGTEESVVDDVTTPGGLRPAPDASDLRRFVEAASAMDGLRLAELLRAKMEGPAASSTSGAGWQVALRALCALEAVLQRGSSQACGEVAVMFQSDPMPVQVLATSQQPLVRDAAARCLRLLLGDDAVPPEAAGGGGGGGGHKGKPHAAAPVRDLLSLDDDGPPVAAAAAPAAAGASGLDLLGDLAGPPVAVAAPAAAAAAAGGFGDSLFSGLDVGSGSGAAAAAPAAADADLFGGLSLPSPAAPAAPAAAPAAAAPPLDDLFSGLGVSAPAAAPAMFQQQQQQQQSAFGQQQPQFGMMQQPGLLGVPGIKVGPPAAAANGSAMGRVMSQSGSGNTFSPSAAAAGAAQQPWSGGLTKNMAAFDFVQDEFAKR